METSKLFDESSLENSGRTDNSAIHFHQFICHEYNKTPDATDNDDDNIDGEMPSFDKMLTNLKETVNLSCDYVKGTLLTRKEYYIALFEQG